MAVFARAPELGKVKTRLSPPLSAEHALALHKALTEDTLERLGSVQRPGLEKVLMLSQPLENPGDLQVPDEFSTGVQAAGSLGERLASLFYTSFRRGVTRVVVLGSDAPTLPLGVVHEAFDLLDNSKVVVGPAEDGGYYLIGCSEWIPEIFQNIDWGTSEVLEQTMKKLHERKIAVDTLIKWYDIDCGEDLDKLRQEIAFLKRSAPELIPIRVAAAIPADGGDTEYAIDTDF